MFAFGKYLYSIFTNKHTQEVHFKLRHPGTVEGTH